LWTYILCAAHNWDNCCLQFILFLGACDSPWQAKLFLRWLSWAMQGLVILKNYIMRNNIIIRYAFVIIFNLMLSALLDLSQASLSQNLNHIGWSTGICLACLKPQMQRALWFLCGRENLKALQQLFFLFFFFFKVFSFKYILMGNVKARSFSI